MMEASTQSEGMVTSEILFATKVLKDIANPDFPMKVNFYFRLKPIKCLSMNNKIKMKNQNERRLKITSKYLQRPFNKGVSRSELRLCGKWLEQYGFEKGQFVTIACEDKRLIITRQ